MSFEEKLAAAFTLLESTGIRRGNYAPPLYRSLWRFGVKLPPPHFNNFGTNFVVMGTFFSIGLGLFMWLLTWMTPPMPPDVTSGVCGVFGTALLAGVLFGLGMAGYYRYGARKHQIPLWRDFSGVGVAPH